MTTTDKKWYASWFDTPYYHILYKDRNDYEAQLFMNTITQYLSIPEGSKILDLACGKGRHSVYLNSIGYDVTGVDLSKNSIDFAKQFENNMLHFKEHDMTLPLGETFDGVFNLFTSFGYFENLDDNLKTIKAIKANLNDTGFGVIDFMNSDYVINNLVAENEKTVDGITFKLQRKIENGYIIKTISFTDKGEDYAFQERVRAFTLKDFETLFEEANVNLIDVFGDYQLKKFNKNTSKRQILIFK